MQNNINKIAKSLKASIKTEKGTKAYDTAATVTRIEGKTAWVHIPGGVDETPVKLTMNAKKGETVQVRVSGGKAWLTGNASAPPTDDTTANKAQTTATEAKYAADNAVAEAVRAKDAADRAETSATAAQESATRAETSATEAKASAEVANNQAISATNSANNALTQLGTVESVVDTLTWIAEHSAFEPSTDASVVASKTYYVPNNQTLTMTDGTYQVSGLTIFIKDGIVTVNGTATADVYFELGTPSVTAGKNIYISGASGGSSQTYGLRYYQAGGSVFVFDGIKKTTAVSGAKYYVYVENGYTATDLIFYPRVANANDGYEYAIVDSPTGNPTSQGYFELDTDDAVKTYVQTHLALTNDGLYVLNDSSAYKMLLANDGMYIQAPNGQTVNQSTANGNVIRSTNGTVIANLGYGSTEGESAISSAPYYTFGTRASGTIGSLSVAEGSGNIASGYCAHVEGVGNKDSTTAGGYGGNHVEGVGNTINTYGNTSHVEGYSNTTNIGVSHIEGYNNTVSYSNVNDKATHVEGYENTVSGNCSHVEGYSNTASGNYQHIEGYNNSATGSYTHVEGSSNDAANSNNTHVEGYNNISDGAYANNRPSTSHLEGANCKIYLNADGGGSGLHAQNIGTIADGIGQTAIGRYNVHMDGGYTLTGADSKDGYALIIGNGTADNARSNALTVDWSGNVNIASGAHYKINGTNLAASDVSAVALSDKYTRSSVGTLDWTNQTDGDAKVIAKSALAFWNGAYSGTSSNLAYCNKGAFGTLATKNSLSASDVGAVPTSRTVNSKALSSNITLSASDVGAFPKSNMTRGISMVSTIPSDGKLTLNNTDIGGSSSAKIQGVLAIPQYSNGVTVKHNYDASSTSQVVLNFYKADGSAYSGAMRYFLITFPNTWTP